MPSEVAILCKMPILATKVPKIWLVTHEHLLNKLPKNEKKKMKFKRREINGTYAMKIDS